MPIISPFVCAPSLTRLCRNSQRSKKSKSRWQSEPIQATKTAFPWKNERRGGSRWYRGIRYGSHRRCGRPPVYAGLTRQESPQCFATTYSPGIACRSFRERSASFHSIVSFSPREVRNSVFVRFERNGVVSPYNAAVSIMRCAAKLGSQSAPFRPLFLWGRRAVDRPLEPSYLPWRVWLAKPFVRADRVRSAATGSQLAPESCQAAHKIFRKRD